MPVKRVMHCRRHPVVAAAALGTAALIAALLPEVSAAAAPGCSQSVQTVTCTYTSGSNPFTVPAGVASVHVVAVGGMGGGVSGGHGAVVTGNLPVTSGTTLYAVVGGNGNFITLPVGSNGGAQAGSPWWLQICNENPTATFCTGIPPSALDGSGGGASDVRTSQNDLSSRLIVAGGGGGAGGEAQDSSVTTNDGFVAGAGAGGDGGGQDGTGLGDGGAGGGGTAAAGGTGGAGGFVDTSGCISPRETCETGGGGQAGVVGLGGAGGGGGVIAGVSTEVLVNAGGAGGGGGGGLYGGGGGGGGGLGAGGGGGGGSNLVAPGGSQSVDTTGVPMVQISYELVPTSKTQCMDGGWRNYPEFKNQGDCVSFVETGK